MIAISVVSHVVVTTLETSRKFQSTVICKHDTSKMFEVSHPRLLRLDKWYIDMMHAIQESVMIQYPTCYIPWLYPYEHLTFQSINIDFDPAFVLSFITSSVVRSTSIFVPNKSLTSLHSAWMASVCCPDESLASPRSPWRAFTSPRSPSIVSACFASKSFSLHCNLLMMPSSFCFSWSGRPQLCNICCHSACPRWPSGTNTFSLHLANTSFAIYVGCRPVPALQPSIHFLIIQPTPNFLIIQPTSALQYMLFVGLSQLYSHQYIFSSFSQPQLCNMCWMSACPSFTAINKFSHHLANPSFAIYVGCQPPVLHYLLVVGLSQLYRHEFIP